MARVRLAIAILAAATVMVVSGCGARRSPVATLRPGTTDTFSRSQLEPGDKLTCASKGQQVTLGVLAKGLVHNRMGPRLGGLAFVIRSTEDGYTAACTLGL